MPRSPLPALLRSPQARPVSWGVVLAVVVGVLAVAVAGLAAATLGVSNETLTREPQVMLEGEAYVGAFSNLGALVWAVSAVVPAFAASMTTGRLRALLAAVAVLSAAMLADDLFLLHDALYPRLGLGEGPVQAAYLLAIAIIVVAGREVVGLPTVLGVGVALAFWGLSTFMDRFLNTSTLNLDQLVEDGAKFVGIVVWAAVWVVRSRLAVREVQAVQEVQAARPAPRPDAARHDLG